MVKTTKKTSNKLFIFCLQNDDGVIQRIFTGTDYMQLWLMATTESKVARSFWSAYDFQGRFIDGNFRVPNIK